MHVKLGLRFLSLTARVTVYIIKLKEAPLWSKNFKYELRHLKRKMLKKYTQKVDLSLI
jgi:hypothetical protein